jgi:hypothetical protein
MIEKMRRREPMEESVGWCFDSVRALISVANREMRAQQKRMDWAYVSNGDCVRYRTSGHGRVEQRRLHLAHKYLVRKEID